MPEISYFEYGGGGGSWGACEPPFGRLFIFLINNIQYLGGEKAQI